MTIRSSIHNILAPAAAKVAAVAAGSAVIATAGLAAVSGASASASAPAATVSSFSFALKPSSPAISACLPNAGGHVTITPGALNDTMKVSLHGMPASAAGDRPAVDRGGS